MAIEEAKRLMARVRVIRRAKALSQEAFAERAGLKYKHFQAMEAGRRLNLQFNTILKLAKGCGLELRDLFDFDAPAGAVSERPAEHYGQVTPKPRSARVRRSSSGRARRESD